MLRSPGGGRSISLDEAMSAALARRILEIDANPPIVNTSTRPWALIYRMEAIHRPVARAGVALGPAVLLSPGKSFAESGAAVLLGLPGQPRAQGRSGEFVSDFGMVSRLSRHCQLTRLPHFPEGSLKESDTLKLPH